MSVLLNQHGEVVNLTEADQMQPGKSEFECGFFACAMARTMSKPGQAPSMSVAQVIANAEQWYAQYNGGNEAGNENGMSSGQEYELLGQIGLHYQAIALNIDQVKAWVNQGYPVLLSITEVSVRDLGLGGANPYPWTPAGNHMLLVTGTTRGGNLLVRDSANCFSLSDPNSLRPGPRTYSAASLQLVSATVVVPPWRPRPASATSIPTADLNIPDGWSDDGVNLTAPNGVSVVGDFRDYILAHAWAASDIPLAPEESADPVEFGYNQPGGNNAGKRQITMYSELCWTTARGVYLASVGREFWTLLNRPSVPVGQGMPAAPAPASAAPASAAPASAAPASAAPASAAPASAAPAPAAQVSASAARSGGGPDPAEVAGADAAANLTLMRDLMAAARLIGDTSTHIQARLRALRIQAQQ